MKIEDERHKIDAPPTFPIEIMHEYRAMACTLNKVKVKTSFGEREIVYVEKQGYS